MERSRYSSARPRLRRSWLQSSSALVRRGLLLAACAGLGSCSFGEEPVSAEQNSCQVDADCATQHCESGRCVAQEVSSLEVTLVVTPKRTPSGSQPLPIVSEPFLLEGGPHTLGLRLPVSVPVRVVYEGKPIAAQASFTPLDTSNRFTAKTTKLSVLASESNTDTTAESAPASAPTNNAMLLDQMEYRVLIQPAESTIPPHSLTFTAENGATLEVDYDEIETQTRKFVLHKAANVPYKVRAVSEVTGAPISNSKTFTGIAGLSSVELEFDDSLSPYKLELTPAEPKAYSTAAAGSCGDEAPQPKISVPSRLFTRDLANPEKWYVEMPELYPAVEYSGVIELCDSQKLTADLQVTLKTEDLYLASGDSETIEGEYETGAAASWDEQANRFQFCARVPPGTYTVIVTPGPDLSCEIFAEKRLLQPNESSGEPDELRLSKPTVLSANVLTPDRMPMPKATVDLLALASSDVLRAANDRSVPNYNRSGSISTGADGSFTLSVDRGKYDVFIKPPETSNYAWRVIYDVAVASNDSEFATEIMLSEPVAVLGQLEFLDGNASDQASLADAEVRAYTLVEVEGNPSEQRSVEIGSGHADEKGVVTLLLPPSLQHSWNP